MSRRRPRQCPASKARASVAFPGPRFHPGANPFERGGASAPGVRPGNIHARLGARFKGRLRHAVLTDMCSTRMHAREPLSDRQASCIYTQGFETHGGRGVPDPPTRTRTLLSRASPCKIHGYQAAAPFGRGDCIRKLLRHLLTAHPAPTRRPSRRLPATASLHRQACRAVISCRRRVQRLRRRRRGRR